MLAVGRSRANVGHDGPTKQVQICSIAPPCPYAERIFASAPEQSPDHQEVFCGNKELRDRLLLTLQDSALNYLKSGSNIGNTLEH